MEWLLKFVILWLSCDIVIIATCWFAVSTIKAHCPNWWENHIAAPYPKGISTSLERRSR